MKASLLVTKEAAVDELYTVIQRMMHRQTVRVMAPRRKYSGKLWQRRGRLSISISRDNSCVQT